MDLGSIAGIMAASQGTLQGHHDPGGRVYLKLPPGVVGGGLFLDHEIYRPVLWRCWDGTDGTSWISGSKDYILFIGMNPSTGTPDLSCPTTDRELKFTQRLTPYRRFIKANIADYRSTYPAELNFCRGGRSPRSPWNLSILRILAREAGMVVACWGNIPKILTTYADETMTMFQEENIKPWCLGINKTTKHPSHPLQLRGDTPLIPYHQD